MSKTNITNETEVTTNEFLAYVENIDGVYWVRDAATGELSDKPCKICSDDKTIALTPNASNRKWIKIAEVEGKLANDGKCGLVYKASHPIGPVGSRLPNAKLVEYLSDEDKATYTAIIERARAAMEADKKKPLTELEKAQKALERAQAKIAALTGDNN